VDLNDALDAFGEDLVAADFRPDVGQRVQAAAINEGLEFEGHRALVGGRGLAAQKRGLKLPAQFYDVTGNNDTAELGVLDRSVPIGDHRLHAGQLRPGGVVVPDFVCFLRVGAGRG